MAVTTTNTPDTEYQISDSIFHILASSHELTKEAKTISVIVYYLGSSGNDVGHPNILWVMRHVEIARTRSFDNDYSIDIAVIR